MILVTYAISVSHFFSVTQLSTHFYSKKNLIRTRFDTTSALSVITGKISVLKVVLNSTLL